MAGAGSATEVIGGALPLLSRTEGRVADYVLAHMDDVPRLTVREVARGSRTSTATVSRFVRHVGYQNFSDLRLAVARERDMLVGLDERESGDVEKVVRPSFAVGVSAIVLDPRGRVLVGEAALDGHRLLSDDVMRGETLEQAVQRLVRVGSGLEVAGVDYVASRYVPRSNAMVACFACQSSVAGAATAEVAGGISWVPIDKALLMVNRGSLSHWFLECYRRRGRA